VWPAMFRQLKALGVVFIISVGIYVVATHRQTETYTVAVAGVVTVHDSAVYTLEGRPGTVTVFFVAGGAAQVGDLLLAGSGSPTWGYSVPPVGGGCWSIRATSHVDGAWIDANIGDLGGKKGVDIHLRIPISQVFDRTLGANGELPGLGLCLDSMGKAVTIE
jgi:hypothetical protein